MKLGEKLQRLRKKSGLSQEQLAAQLTVSRQAVSKWELDETMPDTENVVQLSRLFGVSCDYLLREEVEEPGMSAPGVLGDRHWPSANDRSGGASAAHLDEQGWIHNATILSLIICAMGLVVAIGGSLHESSAGPAVRGLIVQLGGILIFELAVPRMGNGQSAARLSFYAIACWLVLPMPAPFFLRAALDSFGWTQRPQHLLLCCVLLYLALGAVLTAVLLTLRRRERAKT